MNADFAERVAVKSVQQTVQVTAQFVVEARNKLCNFLLCDGGGQVDIPDGQAGEIVVAREQAVQEGRAAAEVAQDEERLFDWLRFVTGEENVIQGKKEPVEQSADGPDDVKENDESQAFTGEAGGCAFPFEKRAVEHAPEQAEVVGHKVDGSFWGFTTDEQR